jgi:NADPH2:quinone reductase
MSSWVALTARAKFVAGESVLILGATGVAGQLAVQIAKRLGARRVVAAGRNPDALAILPSLGADAVISLDQPEDALIAAFRAEYETGIDVVLDYLWGPPAESLLKAISQKGLGKVASSRVRFTQIGSSAGTEITLPAATLRSSGLELIGSGFGSASLEQIKLAVVDLFKIAATEPFKFSTTTAPLSQIAALWNTPEKGTRLIFKP